MHSFLGSFCPWKGPRYPPNSPEFFKTPLRHNLPPEAFLEPHPYISVLC